MHPDNLPEKTWRFIRGDLSVNRFEEWIYSDNTLEEKFGDNLYFEIISTDYTRKKSILKIRNLLKEFISTSFPQKCHCLELSDLAIIDMGDESEKVLNHVNEIQKRGEDYWWLSVNKCPKCNQVWLVASEERHNDIYCLQRLDELALNKILTNNQWPTIFDKYETLLRLGFEAGRSVRFIDPHESSLQWTITDLAKERPGIHVTEIAQLLNLSLELAIVLSKKVINNENVQIGFN